MRYGVEKNQISQQAPKFPTLSANENVFLEKTEYVSEVGKDGKPFEAIRFTYFKQLSPDRKAVIKDTMFAIVEEGMQPWRDKTLEETITKSYENFNTRLIHVAESFNVSLEDLKIAFKDSTTFEELATSYCNLLNSKCAGIPVWLKTITNKRGYATVPGFPDFIQPMSDQTCTLKYSKWEHKSNLKNSQPSEAVEEDNGSWAGDEDEF